MIESIVYKVEQFCDDKIKMLVWNGFWSGVDGKGTEDEEVKEPKGHDERRVTHEDVEVLRWWQDLEWEGQLLARC